MKVVNKEEKNELAIIGFACSIFGYVTGGLTSIVGLILSIIGLKKAKKLEENNKTFAVVGIILSILQILAIIAFISFFIIIDKGYTLFGGDPKDKYVVVEEQKYVSEDNEVSITGKLTNISAKKLSNINIEYITYDEEGNITGSCSEWLEELPSKKTWKFDAICTAPDRDVAKFKRKEVIINGL